MKKLLLVCILVMHLSPKTANAQEGAAAAAGIVGGLVAIGVGIAAIEQMKENAELTATQWVLTNRPELENFSLKTLDFDGKKLKDMSAATVISFKIQEFIPQDKPELDGKKQVLFGFTSHGWINQYGIDYTKVKWHLIDRQEWMNMMVAYARVASSIKDESSLAEVLEQGKIVNNGVRMGGKLEIPFFKLSGDMYVVTDYSSDMKLLYNERSLGIFLKNSQDLVQIGRGDIIKIHDFFFQE